MQVEESIQISDHYLVCLRLVSFSLQFSNMTLYHISSTLFKVMITTTQNSIMWHIQHNIHYPV